MGSSARGVWKAQKAPNATVNIMIISIQNRKNGAIVPEGRKWLQTKVAVTGSRFRKEKKIIKKISWESLSLSHTLFSSSSQTLTSTLSPQRGFLWNDREISISLYSPTLAALKATVCKMSHTHDCFYKPLVHQVKCHSVNLLNSLADLCGPLKKTVNPVLLQEMHHNTFWWY